MKRNVVFFCLTVVVFIFAFRKIPLEFLFQSGSLKPYATDIRVLILGIAVVIINYVAAKKYKLLEFGGFAKPYRRNYWFLLLPFFFPGLLFGLGSELVIINPPGILVFSLALSISIGMLEETTFRGLILGYIRKNMPEKSDHTICLIAASIFALIHFTNLQKIHLISVLPQVIYAFYMGLFLSALLFRTNNVWLLGMVHGLLNYISSKGDVLSRDRETFVEEGFTLSDYLIQILSLTLLFSPLLFFYWIIMRKRPKSP